MKQFWKDSIMKRGASADEKVDSISTGSLAVDMALGVGGFPRGRVVEIFGPEASGKTTLALHAVASAQRAGGTAAFIDAEHALDATWARTCGVNTDDLLISQPDNGQQALEIADTLVRSGAVDIVVIDSVAALVPREEIEGEMGDSFVGLQARLMSQALRKLTGSISKTKTTVIFINQLREKIGVMFGNPETTSGGRALKFYASVRIDIRPIEPIKQGDVVIGRRVKVKVVKNKVAPPFRIAEIEILEIEAARQPVRGCRPVPRGPAAQRHRDPAPSARQAVRRRRDRRRHRQAARAALRRRPGLRQVLDRTALALPSERRPRAGQRAH